MGTSLSLFFWLSHFVPVSVFFSPLSFLLLALAMHLEYAVQAFSAYPLPSHIFSICSYGHTDNPVTPWSGQDLRGNWGQWWPLAYPFYCPGHAHGREWPCALHCGNSFQQIRGNNTELSGHQRQLKKYQKTKQNKDEIQNHCVWSFKIK